jgi:hypothetical protein
MHAISKSASNSPIDAIVVVAGSAHAGSIALTGSITAAGTYAPCARPARTRANFPILRTREPGPVLFPDQIGNLQPIFRRTKPKVLGTRLGHRGGQPAALLSALPEFFSVHQPFRLKTNARPGNVLDHPMSVATGPHVHGSQPYIIAGDF